VVKFLFRKYDIRNLIGLTLTGLTSGVKAVVIEADYASETEIGYYLCQLLKWWR